jgi:transcriptional regulator with XRE-family HTH domain
MKTVGSKIKYLRIQNGWSQKVVAARLKMSIPAFSKIECGVTDVNLSRLEQIAECYNRPVIELITLHEGENTGDEAELARVNELLESKDAEIRRLQARVIQLFEELRRSN